MDKSILENAVYSLIELSQFLARNVVFPALYRQNLIISDINPEIIKESYEIYWNKTSCEISFKNELFLIPFDKDILKTRDCKNNTLTIRSDILGEYSGRWG